MLNDFIKRLLMMRLFSMEDTKINLLKQDQFLLDTDLIVQMQECKSTDFAKIVKENTKNKIKDYTKVLGSKPASISEDTLSALFGTLGFGNIKIMKLNREKNRVFLQLTNSPIVAAYKKLKIKRKEPACIFINSMLAGSFTAIFEKEVECEETKCSINGGKSCTFIVQEGKK